MITQGHLSFMMSLKKRRDELFEEYRKNLQLRKIQSLDNTKMEKYDLKQPVYIVIGRSKMPEVEDLGFRKTQNSFLKKSFYKTSKSPKLVSSIIRQRKEAAKYNKYKYDAKSATKESQRVKKLMDYLKKMKSKRSFSQSVSLREETSLNQPQVYNLRCPIAVKNGRSYRICTTTQIK